MDTDSTGARVCDPQQQPIEGGISVELETQQFEAPSA